MGPMAMPTTGVTEFDNGVSLHVTPCTDIPVLRVSTVWGYGSAHAPAGISPYSPVMAAMCLTEGADGISAARIAENIDFNGAEITGEANPHRSRLVMTTMTPAAPAMLELCRTLLTRPDFPADMLDIKRRQALEGVRLSRTQSGNRAIQHLRGIIAGANHPYVTDDMTAWIGEATRTQLQQAWHEGRQRAWLKVFASGHITPGVSDVLEEYAQSLRSQHIDPAPDIIVPYAMPDAYNAHLTMPGSTQSAVAIAIPAIGMHHPDSLKLHCTTVALGGYFGSRLMTNIREDKGLTYGISAFVIDNPEGAYILISAQCDAAYVERVRTEITAELERLASEPMDEAELQRLKSYLMSREASRLETPMTIGAFEESRTVNMLPANRFALRQATIRDLDASTVRDMATRYLDPAKQLVVTAGA